MTSSSPASYLTQIEGQVNTLVKSVGQQTVEVAAKAAQLDQVIQEEAQRQAFQSVSKVTLASLQINLNLYRESLAGGELILKKTEEGVRLARQKVEEVQALIDQNTGFLKDVEKWVAQYKPLSGLLGSWESDIDAALSAYVQVGLQTGVNMVRRESGTLDAYAAWWTCWSPVFIGVPSVIPQTGCAVMNKYDEVMKELDKLGDVAYLVFPFLTIKRDIEIKIRKEVKSLMNQGAVSLVSVISGDKDLGRLVGLLMAPGQISEDKLASAFTTTGTKNLLALPDVAQRVQVDLKVKDGNFTDFAAAQNAVTLTKMALLDAAQANALFSNVTGRAEGPYTLSKVGEPFSILLGMVRSLDGNHQWQAYGLPYPRQAEITANWVEGVGNVHFGYTVSEGGGFPFWTDNQARQLFFGKIFIGPLTPSLDAHASLARYPFPECTANPFPLASADGEKVEPSDLICRPEALPLQARFAAWAKPTQVVQVGSQQVEVGRSPIPYVWAVLLALLAITLNTLYLRKTTPGVLVTQAVVGLILVLLGRGSSPLAALGWTLLLLTLIIALVVSLKAGWRIAGRLFGVR